ncbi:hypothetical protein B0H11DRAFT_2204659 [Mycena galericulata]|nr:hypothetical protein B0H11DRAFT_2204659 [Mycena galericulata]
MPSDSPSSKKRKIDESNIDDIDLDATFQEKGIDGLFDLLTQELGTKLVDKMTKFLAHRKPFSEVTYEAVADYFGLAGTEADPFEGWGDLEVLEIILPTSVTETLVSRIIESCVSPGPVPELGNEAATGLFLTGSLQSLTTLFGGILQNRPEAMMAGTDLSWVGKIEGEVFCCEGTLVFVRELKYRAQYATKKFLKSLGQVLCELFAAWHQNRRVNNDIDENLLMPVHALLYDASDAFFISYDGVKFRKRIFRNLVPSAKGEEPQEAIGNYAYNSLLIENYTFALLLEGYLDTVRLYHQRSLRRGNVGDADPRGSHRTVLSAIPVPPTMGTALQRLTTKDWETTFELAYKSRAYFQRASLAHCNEHAETGLDLLYKSLEAWPDGGGLMLPEKVKTLTAAVMKRHEKTLVASDSELQWKPALPSLASLTTEARKKRAVDLFWAKFPANFRQKFEPVVRFENDSFEGLATVALDPEAYRPSFVGKGPVALVDRLIRELKASQKANHWRVT